MKNISKYILETKEIDLIKDQIFEKLIDEVDIFYYGEPTMQSIVANFLSHYKDIFIISPYCNKNKSDIAWITIQDEFEFSKSAVSKILNNFIPDDYKRHVILRDIGNSIALLSLGFNKEAVILSGGVIEEIIRLFILSRYNKKYKNFYDLLEMCNKNNLFKKSIQKLTDSIREFRNLVHLKKEVDKSCTINKSNAKGAVASIFSIISAIKEFK